MGMIGRIHDAINLAGKLVLRTMSQTMYSICMTRQRRTVAVDYVQAQTIRNKRMLDERDPKIRSRNLAALKEMVQNRTRGAGLLLATSVIDSVEASLQIV